MSPDMARAVNASAVPVEKSSVPPSTVVAIASRPGAGTQVTVRVPAGSPPAPVIHQLMEAADA